MCQTTLPHYDLPPADLAAERGRFLSRLREAGYLSTAQRLAIVDAILQTGDHICAEHILAAAGRERPELRINKTTVYRALDLFLSLGLITEMKQADGRAQYELASHGPHAHMVCARCGSLTDLDLDLAALLRGASLARHGFAVDLASYPISGTCAACRA